MGYMQSFRSLQRWMLGGSGAGCGPVEEIPSLGESPETFCTIPGGSLEQSVSKPELYQPFLAPDDFLKPSV